MITQMICLQFIVLFFILNVFFLTFYSVKLLVLLNSEKVLLYLYETKLIPYITLAFCFLRLDLWFENYKSRVDMWRLSGWTKRAFIKQVCSTDLISSYFPKSYGEIPLLFCRGNPCAAYFHHPSSLHHSIWRIKTKRTQLWLAFSFWPAT